MLDTQKDFAKEACITIREHRKTRFGKDELRFIVPSATQAGKTRAMIEFCKQYKKEFTKDQKLMIVILGLSASDVRSNTMDDFHNEGGLGSEIATMLKGKSISHYIHPGNSNTKNIKLILQEVKKIRQDGGHIIWINDEADVASGGTLQENDEFLLRLRRFVKDNSVPLWDIQPPFDRSSEETGLHITATLAHLLPFVQDETLVDTARFCSFQLDETYAGLDTLNILGVFYDNSKYLGKENRDLLEKMIMEWGFSDENEDDPLYHIVRISCEKTRNSIANKWKESGYRVEEYDCNHGNINELSNRFDEKPVIPTLILLKQAFARGSRINTVDYIGECFDSKRSNDAAVIQSIPGRMTGRKSGTGKNRKDSYNVRLKIYCDIDAISKEVPAIEAQRINSPINHEIFLKENYPGMSGTHCKMKTGKHKKYINPEVVGEFLTREDLDKEIKNLGVLYDVHGIQLKNLTLNTFSKNLKDVAGECLFSIGRYHPGEDISKNAYISVHADSPGKSVSHENSWKFFPYKKRYLLIKASVVEENSAALYYRANHGIT